MDPLIILLIGMAVVIGGVLWLRLHAFVALIGGALVWERWRRRKDRAVGDERHAHRKGDAQTGDDRLGKDDPNLTNLVQVLHKPRRNTPRSSR